jgi:hypothetical protein
MTWGDLMTDVEKLCVLTVHSIGFQQPPTDSAAGYADVLHENLSDGLQAVGGSLGNDPQRKPGPFGPVYVMRAKPGTHDHEWGLKRLGTWRGDSIDVTGMPLAEGAEPVVHVALIYTSLEGVSPGLGREAGALGEAGFMLGHYASVVGALRLVVGDTWAALPEGDDGAAPVSSPSPRLRDDVLTARQHHLAALLHRKPASSGALGVVRTLEDDVVAYVCRNDLRESIRRFIVEALRRLLARPGVGGVAVNAHSQGTVGSFDVLRLYPSDSLAGVRAFITVGSPLRKYADLFYWGNGSGGLQSTRWLNFWDEKDPVADPLGPPNARHYGSPPDGPSPGEPGLFYALDGDGNQKPVTVTDIEVDNLKNSSGGGLQAHNYWDNKGTIHYPASGTAENRGSLTAAYAGEGGSWSQPATPRQPRMGPGRSPTR